MKLIFLFCLILLNASYGKEGIKSIRFLSSYIIPTGTQFKNTQVGGLSGLVYDSKKNRYFAVSDDRGDYGPNRIYELSIDLNPFKVEIKDVLILKDANGKMIAKDTFDFEGIVILNNGNFLLSSEGFIGPSNNSNPQFVEVNRNGEIIRIISPAKNFLMHNNSGVEDNLGIESIVYNSKNDHLIYANELSLKQDKLNDSIPGSSFLRLHTLNFKTLKNLNEEVYSLDSNYYDISDSKIDGDLGLSEITLFNPDTLLFLERGFNPKMKKNFISIFQGQLTKKKHSLLPFVSLKKQKIELISKELLLDFKDLSQSLDNLEGMCIGPQLPNKNYSLLLVSDNNFNKFQKTLFLIFEIIPYSKNN